jgi:glycerophosphoryl diester phosphodiesterase
MWFLILTIALVFLVAYGIWNRRPPPAFQVLQFTPPLHISHRGGASIGPENTIPTFARSIREFATDVLEIDVRGTADGVPVVFHDADVSRTTNGSGLVHQTQLRDLQEMDAAWWFSPDGGGSYPLRKQGYRVPTLDEVLREFPAARLHIDVKQASPRIVAAVLAILRRHGAQDRVFLGSSFDGITRQIRRDAPDFATFPARYGLWTLYGFHLAHALWLYHFRDEVISIVPTLPMGRQVVTPRLVRSIHARGRRIFVFLVDDPSQQRRLLEMGVDGIMTDRPDVLRACLNDWEAVR